MFTKRFTLILCLSVAAVFVASIASAQVRSSSITRKFKNNSSLDRTDLHITFNGPVDAVTGVSGYNPPFGDITNDGTNVIELSNGTVADGDSTGCIRFSSSADGLAIVSASWTPDNIPLNPANDIGLCSSWYPTLSEWGIIMFSLLVLSLITVVVTRRQAAVAGAGGGAELSASMGGPLFVKAVYLKALAVTLALAGIGLAIALAVSGTVALRDSVGTILSAAIVAYMAHVWICRNRE